MKKMDEKGMIKLLLQETNFSDVDVFIKNNDVDSVDREGRTLLISAIGENNFELAEYLIAKGYAVNAKDKQGLTGLHIAAIYDYKDIAQLLLKNGANIDEVDAWGNTPLWRSAMNSKDIKSETAVLLLAHGADINKKNKSGVAPSDLF